jgi:hypothetical protein
MVRGRATAVTSVAGGYQCAETQRIAFGRGIVSPIVRHPSVYAFDVIAFIGLPWPKKGNPGSVERCDEPAEQILNGHLRAARKP